MLHPLSTQLLYSLNSQVLNPVMLYRKMNGHVARWIVLMEICTIRVCGKRIGHRFAIAESLLPQILTKAHLSAPFVFMNV